MLGYKLIGIFLFISSILYARQIETFYGTIEIDEPVLLELIDSPTFQRLRFIHQYGLSYYTTHKEEYNRYDHSLGVFALLQKEGVSLKEQVAGLLHDVSHTVFSHSGDFIFEKSEEYHEDIHTSFLQNCDLVNILKKYGFEPSELLPQQEFFPALDCPLPDLCADRIDYNIQGAYYQGFIAYDEAVEIFKDLRFIGGIWVSTLSDLMESITLFSLFMTEDCWGSPITQLTNKWFAEAIWRAIDLGSVSFEEIHSGTDQVVWNKLINHNDPFIQEKMKVILRPEEHFSFVTPFEADLVLKAKFRGIDPWILSDSKCLRLTSIRPSLLEKYNRLKKTMEQGWPVSLRI